MQPHRFDDGDALVGHVGRPMGLLTHHLAGELDVAATAIPSRPIAWQMISAIWATTAARLAIDRDDLACASRALALIENRDSAPTASLTHAADWAHALLRGAADEALDSAARALETGYGPVSTVFALVNLAETFASLGQWNDALANADRAAVVLGGIAEAAPLPCASIALLRARAALAVHDLATARTATHDAINAAVGANLRLRAIDAVEITASIYAESGDQPAAARLLASATTERERIGYRGRLTSGVPQTLADRLVLTEPGSWKAGTGLLFEQATNTAVAALVGAGEVAAVPKGRTPKRG